MPLASVIICCARASCFLFHPQRALCLFLLRRFCLLQLLLHFLDRSVISSCSFSDNVLSVQTHSQPYALGIRGFGGVGVVTQGPARSVAETIVGIPETTLVAATSGRYDVLVEFWYRDEEQLLSILDRVRAHPGVRSIESMFYLTVEKEDFSYGLTQLDRDHTKETEANSL